MHCLLGPGWPTEYHPQQENKGASTANVQQVQIRYIQRASWRSPKQYNYICQQVVSWLYFRQNSCSRIRCSQSHGAWRHDTRWQRFYHAGLNATRSHT